MATPKALRNPTLEARGRSGLTTPPLVQFQAEADSRRRKIGNGMISFCHLSATPARGCLLPPPVSRHRVQRSPLLPPSPRPADGPEQQDLRVPSCSVASYSGAPFQWSASVAPPRRHPLPPLPPRPSAPWIFSPPRANAPSGSACHHSRLQKRLGPPGGGNAESVAKPYT